MSKRAYGLDSFCLFVTSLEEKYIEQDSKDPTFKTL